MVFLRQRLMSAKGGFRAAVLANTGMPLRFCQPLSGEKSRTFPHPANPCLQSCHPARGYAARRGSQAGSALSVREGREPSPEGPAENGLPPATRGKRQGIGQTLSFHARTARRMCLCGTQGGWVWRMRRHRPPGWQQSGRGKPLSVHNVLKVRSCAAKNRNGPSRKPAADIHRHRPLQRDRSRRQKPLNGALKGATYTHFYEAASSAPSDASKTHGRRFRRVDVPACDHHCTVDFSFNGFTATLQVPATPRLSPQFQEKADDRSQDPCRAFSR
ncbi:hypothetical protein BSY16_3785 [Sinorhizobium sp. RAC02]|nr:hypothetical protein BSY16_3785 [Sinorhizobium sp. RAC02]